MASSQSSRAAVTAVGAGLFIVAAKVTAYLFTRSSGMLSEAIHSLVDTLNDTLLMLGVHSAAKPADETHPFGYGKELYFWTLLVALFLFLLGGCSSIYEGVHRLLHPEPLAHAAWSYTTLGVAACFEGYSLYVSLREFRKSEGVPASLATIHASKDPTNFTVIFEDAAALLGIVLALVGTFFADHLGLFRADGIASIAIGCLLLVVALLLIAESKALLVGEGVDVDDLRTIRSLAAAQDGVEHVGYPMTMYFGPENILLTMNVLFERSLTRNGIQDAIDAIEAAVRHRFPHIRHIYLEAESLRTTIAFDPTHLPQP